MDRREHEATPEPRATRRGSDGVLEPGEASRPGPALVNAPSRARPVYPAGSALSLVGRNATPASFEVESVADLFRKHFLATRFSPEAKFSPLSGARIAFGDDDLPFNASVPFDPERTTLPEDEHAQMLAGMVDARLNPGPMTWGLRPSREGER